MITIFEREFKGYLFSAFGWIFTALFFMAASVYFAGNLITKSVALPALFSGIASTVIYLIPLLTVGLISKEKRQGADRLLAAMPISNFSVVFGKYLAALAFYLIPLILSSAFVIALGTASKLNGAHILWGYAGLLLFGALLLAFGLFIGSLTKRVSAAALSSVGILAVVSILVTFKTIPNLSAFWVGLIDFLSFGAKFNQFFENLLSPEPFIYFISLTALFIYLTTAAAGSAKRG
jgi:ABC-2 type transport system permease protein